MSTYLPPYVRLKRIIGNKTLGEYFQETIKHAEQSTYGKKYEHLTVKQKVIVDLWFLLELESRNDPKKVIFEHFNVDDSNVLSDQVNNGSNPVEAEVIVEPRRT